MPFTTKHQFPQSSLDIREMFCKQVSLVLAMFYGAALVVASSEGSNLNSRSISDIETRDSTRPM
ncbi:hypothetical protein HHX47_DHR1001973 [Lentinula edodes]|nr:hypothetical protein HHX47_DHR1001973 [Lentinula edodes]